MGLLNSDSAILAQPLEKVTWLFVAESKFPALFVPFPYKAPISVDKLNLTTSTNFLSTMHLKYLFLHTKKGEWRAGHQAGQRPDLFTCPPSWTGACFSSLVGFPIYGKTIQSISFISCVFDGTHNHWRPGRCRS